jgi:phosphate starvation-inducible PhoH-like protein
MKHTKRLTRRERQMQAMEIPTPRIIPKPVPRLEPKNSRQREALGYLQEGRPVVFLTGSAGTGKSLLAAYRAATQFSSKAIRKVYLVRPAVSVGKSIGLLPGEIEEKLAPYFAQTIAHLSKFLGPGPLDHALKAKDIELKPVEYLRGMSFENCLVIAEEVQNFTAEEMEMMLTRLGDNCQIIFTGDTKQHDLKGDSGLETTLKLIDKTLQGHPEYMNHEDMDALDDGIGAVRFLPEDVLRSGMTRAFVKMYFHNT